MKFVSSQQKLGDKTTWLVISVLLLLLADLILAIMEHLAVEPASRDNIIHSLSLTIVVTAVVSATLFYLLAKIRYQDKDYIQLKTIIHGSPIPTLIKDNHDKVIFINTAFEYKFGYDISELSSINQWWQKACANPNDCASIVSLYESYRESLTTQHKTPPSPFNTQIKCADGQIRSVLVSVIQLYNNYRNLELIVFYDVSQQMDTIGTLAKTKNFLSSIIETIPLKIFWKDTHSRYLGCNTAFAKDAGKESPEEIIGKTDLELVWKENAAQYVADDMAVIRSDKAILDFEESQTGINNEQRILRTSKVPLHNDAGDVIGMLGIYDDITQVKKNEEELWLTKNILDQAETSFLRHDKNGKIIYANDYACAELGYSRNELLGMYPWDYTPDLSANDWPFIWEMMTQKGTITTETQQRCKDGQIIDVHITGHCIRFNDKLFNFTIIQNITDKKRQERELQQKEGYLRSLIDSLPFQVWLKDRQGHFLAVNTTAIDSKGDLKHPDKVIGKTDLEIHPKELAEAYLRDDQIVMDTKTPILHEEEQEQSGKKEWVETFKAPVLDKSGEVLGTVGYARNISERKKLETELRIAAIAFESQEGMVITNAYIEILKINRAFTRITGYTSDEVIGKTMSILKSGMHDKDFYNAMWQQIREIGSWQGEIWNRRKSGEIYPEWLTITAVRDQDGNITHYVGTMIDITTRKAIEEKIHHLAHHDALTDLPNRVLLTDRLHQAIAHARRKKSQLALIYLDLDKFKPVNDTLGHDIGDLLLCEVANRILQCVKRETDTVSRLGGDEFVILLSNIENKREAAIVAERILYVISQPFQIQKETIEISSSLGISIYPDHGTEAIEIMKNADNAMYDAKNAGRNCYRFYQSDNQ